jgi:Zn-dependent protease/predicted transcriptional regulator
MRLGTIRGIPIKAQWSLLVIVGLITWSLAEASLPELAEGYTTLEYWVSAIFTALAFFAALLVHELSHSLVARQYGIRVRDITLWLLGGISRIEEEPATPSQELRVALAGPAASLAIAVGGLAAGFIFSAFGVPRLVVACIVWTASINLLLAVFNLVPAAPLDGGRVLRAILWRRHGDRTRAAISATRAGRNFAFALVTLGFLELVLTSNASGLWLVLLGWFVLTASRAEEAQIRTTRDLAGVRVEDVMTPDPWTVPADLNVDDVLRDYVLKRHCSSFPVVDGAGHVTGLVTLRQLRFVPASKRSSTGVADVLIPISDVPHAAPNDVLLDVLRTGRNPEGRLLVFRNGHLVGIVSPTDITRAISAAELAYAD